MLVYNKQFIIQYARYEHIRNPRVFSSKLAKLISVLATNNKQQRTDQIMKFSEVTVEYAKNRDQALLYKEPGTSIYGGFCSG
jgi:hypothetical protein